MAMPLDRQLEVDDFVPDFRQNIGRISGALMEIGSDMIVRFIHVSFLDYIRDPKRLGRNTTSEGKTINTDETLAHASLAACCLSYLYYTIPHNPLGGSAQTTADPRYHTRKYPFLEYAVEFWSLHLLECIKKTNVADLLIKTDQLDPLIQLLPRFLSNTRAVTVWIEASWMFGHPPRIGEGSEYPRLQWQDTLSTSLGIQESSKLQKAFNILRHLAKDLQSLNRDWEKVLRNTPNEIWEPSISAFTQSPFWLSVTGSNITPLALEKESICLISRVSKDGYRLGVVRLYPPIRYSSSKSDHRRT